MIHRGIILVIAALQTCVTAAAAEPFPGPVTATVVEVIDGDSFRASAEVWPGYSVAVIVRIRGIDAPEMRGRCSGEKRAAQSARETLARLLGTRVVLANVAGAKYYGRVLADVTTPDGLAVADAMLGEETARPYSGGRRTGWCG